MIPSKNPALVVIDVQQAIDHFDVFERSHREAEQNIAQLLNHWRTKRWPVVHVRHSSKDPCSPYHANSAHYAFKPEVAPLSSEIIVTKQENCAFIDTRLEDHLRQQGVSELVVAGVLLNHSVDATVRVGKALGFRIMLAADACPASSLTTGADQLISADQVHQIMIANLANEYAEIKSCRQLLSS
tara:strand:+ start:23228 stop:23782 length:555 start_codon:yes stop_codon:yes gene_type:complete